MLVPDRNGRGVLEAQQEDAIRAHVHRSLRLLPSDRLLDVGCGDGRIAFGLSERIISLDLEVPLERPARFVRAGALALPFPDASFEAAIQYGVSIHLTRDDFAQSLSEIRRVLRPGGVVLIGDLSYPWRRYARSRTYNRQPRLRALKRQMRELARMGLGGGYGWYSPGQVRRLARSAGLEWVRLVEQPPECPWAGWHYDVLLRADHSTTQ